MWLEAGGAIGDYWRATPRVVMIAHRAYLERRAWAAFASGMTARGAVGKIDDLLPQPPESEDERAARIDRALMAWDLRLAAMEGNDG